MSIEETPESWEVPRASPSRLKRERERRCWTQTYIAKSIGTTQANVSRWENGALPSLYYRQKLSELFEMKSEELGLTAVAREEILTERLIPAVPSPSLTETHSPLWHLPHHRNPFFTGRDEVLSALHTMLGSNNAAALTQAISGLGGIGKTQIAMEYSYRYRDSYTAILWATASSHDALMADFVALANVLNLPERREQDQEIAVYAVKRWLGTHENWLLILDNVEDLKLLVTFLPTQRAGKVLLTTRLQALGSFARGIEVEKMSLQEGVLFLLRRIKLLAPGTALAQATPETRAQAAKIVEELDGLPLALDQAGAYIEETRCGFSSYLNLYHIRRKELLMRRGMLPTDHPEPVATTWSLSFQRIEQESQAAADLLRLLAFLNADAIPEEILTAGAAELGPVLGSAANDPLLMNGAIELLLRYSLLRRSSETKLLSIHRLVQAVLKDDMDRSLQCIWSERAIRAINRAFPDAKLKNWTQCQRCLPHAQISANYIDEYGFTFPEAARLMNETAIYLIAHAQYLPAEILLQKALALRQQVLGTTHLDTALTLNNLGMLYLTQGDYRRSEAILQESLAIFQQTSGAQHATTATGLNNLALLYYALGKYVLAEQLYQQALHIRQAIFDTDHHDIAQSLNNLAELYTIQGKYTLAESLYVQALANQEKTLGSDHPDVAQTLNNLALLYRSKGEYVEAERLYGRALHIQEQILGKDHPDAAQTLNNLARLYRAQGKYTQAEPLYQQALYIREVTLGPEHPEVAQSLYSLAKLYHSQGKYLQAEEFCQRALRLQEQRLGPSHPSVASTLSMLAKIYQDQNKLNDAIEVNLRALHIREHASGKDHPHIAIIANSLAEIYHLQGKYHEAEPLIERSLFIHEQALGADHPYMAYSLSNRAENYFMRREYEQAEMYFKKALAIREQHLGSEHPRTASVYYNLARLYTALDRWEEAEAMAHKALAIRRKVLGPEHPSVIISLELSTRLFEKRHRTDRGELPPLE